MAKYIVLTIIVIAAIVGAAWYFRPVGQSPPAADLSEALLDLDVIDSPIERVEAPDIDIAPPALDTLGISAPEVNIP